MNDIPRHFESSPHNRIRPTTHYSSEGFIRHRDRSHHPVNPSTSYTVDLEPSIFSEDINRWIAGDSSAIDTSVQNSRVTTTVRSTLTMSSSLIDNGVWYTLAMVLPLLSGGDGLDWRCTPSFVFTTGEMLFSQLATLCGRLRDQVRNLAQDQIVREIFATAIDIVLVIYALGFLVLSMCQASVAGQSQSQGL